MMSRDEGKSPGIGHPQGREGGEDRTRETTSSTPCTEKERERERERERSKRFQKKKKRGGTSVGLDHHR